MPAKLPKQRKLLDERAQDFDPVTSYRAGIATRIEDLAVPAALPPLVSIIVDNYNYARFLGVAIDSALDQTYRRVEVIVVDDGSTDDSVRVIRRYGDRITPVFKANGGQASAFNAGYERAGGQIVMFLDADDALHPDAVARVVAAFAPGVAKVQFRLRHVDAAGLPMGDTEPPMRLPMTEGDQLATLLRRGVMVCPPTSGNAFLRETIAPLMPLDEHDWRLAGDTPLVYGAAFAGRVVSLAEPAGDYRRHGTNLWRDRPPEASHMARLVREDVARERLVRTLAARQGLAVPPDLRFRDWRHVLMHAAVMLEPGARTRLGEPSLASLCRRGLAALWRVPDLALRKRLALALYVAALPFLPRDVARQLVTWHLFPQTRPRSRPHAATS